MVFEFEFFDMKELIFIFLVQGSKRSTDLKLREMDKGQWRTEVAGVGSCRKEEDFGFFSLLWQVIFSFILSSINEEWLE